ncbi:MAG: NAD(+)/NADH kinase [Kiritimatiellae bacterium]|jgi:NAD+ kinase|nr:NAD(+)/NADH kinase [Kiritimatiellia bacterium]
MKTIGVITNFNKPNAADLLEKVVACAENIGFDVWVECSENVSSISCRCCEVSQFFEKTVEAVVVLGGDGTMLDTAHQLGINKLPMMGLNIGSLGYLTSVEDHQYEEALNHLYNGSFNVSYRTALSMKVIQQSGETHMQPDALNDAVISRGATGHAVKLELILDGLKVSRFLCDGIIVATPTGSTAYSLSAGGPIVMPDTPAFVVSLICPHSLTSRPLVLCDTTDILIRVIECSSPMLVSSDGRRNVLIEQGGTIEIKKSELTVPVVELHGYNPYGVLRHKLSWGGRGG